MPPARNMAGVGSKKRVMKRPAASFRRARTGGAPPPTVSLLDFTDDASRNDYLSKIDVPMELMPTQAPSGKRSYTVRTEGGAAVQVLVAKRAFFLVSKHGGVLEDGTKQTYAWGGSPTAAWKELRTIAGWDVKCTCADC